MFKIPTWSSTSSDCSTLDQMMATMLYYWPPGGQSLLQHVTPVTSVSAQFPLQRISNTENLSSIVMTHYRPRSGEGNVFTGICLSTGGLPMEGGGLHGKGVCMKGADPLPPPTSSRDPLRYGQPAVGTHLTGMLSCLHCWRRIRTPILYRNR